MPPTFTFVSEFRDIFASIHSGVAVGAHPRDALEYTTCSSDAVRCCVITVGGRSMRVLRSLLLPMTSVQIWWHLRGVVCIDHTVIPSFTTRGFISVVTKQLELLYLCDVRPSIHVTVAVMRVLVAARLTPIPPWASKYDVALAEPGRCDCWCAIRFGDIGQSLSPMLVFPVYQYQRRALPTTPEECEDHVTDRIARRVPGWACFVLFSQNFPSHQPQRDVQLL